MAYHNPADGNAAYLCCFDEFFALQAQRLAAHDTRHVQPGDHPDSHEDQQDVLPKEGYQQDHEEHEREGVQDFQQTHHHGIHFAAKIAGKGAVKRADDHRHQRGGDTDHQGDTTTDSHTHQQVAARGVGAEVVAGNHIRRAGHHAPVRIEIGELRQHRRQGYEQGDEDQHHQTGDRRAVMHKATAGVLPQAAPFDFEFLTEVFQRLAVFLTQHHGVLRR
ncbi:hypothetical protein D3C72_1120930 [compost metagenome]